MPSQTTIASFVIRFVQEFIPDEAGRPVWRGLIKHVQSSEERPFTRFADAVAFIADYVEIGEDVKRET